jgi:hypothetical protein
VRKQEFVVVVVVPLACRTARPSLSPPTPQRILLSRNTTTCSLRSRSLQFRCHFSYTAIRRQHGDLFSLLPAQSKMRRRAPSPLSKKQSLRPKQGTRPQSPREIASRRRRRPRQSQAVPTMEPPYLPSRSLSTRAQKTTKKTIYHLLHSLP